MYLIREALLGGSGGGGGGGGGGGSDAVPYNDVMFYDYDGTRLYSYSKAQFLALSAMPDNPEHDRLTAKGWNWTLSDAKAYVTNYGMLDIGQMYEPTSGKTEIDTEFFDCAKHLYLRLYVNGTATIEWGDGSTSTLTGTSLVSGQQSVDHVYASGGEYTISISGNVKPYYVSTAVCWYSDGTTKGASSQNANLIYTGNVKRVFMSKDFVLNSEMFSGFVNLEAVTVSPDSDVDSIHKLFLTSVGNETTPLRGFVIPTNITNLGQDALVLNSLKVVCFNKNITSLSTTQGTFPKKCFRLCLPPQITAVYSSDFTSSQYARAIVFPDLIASGISSVSQPPNLKVMRYPAATTSCSIQCNNCYNLVKIYFPSTCTEITSSLNAARVLREIHVLATTPPTLTSGALDNFSADGKIYVPSASLAAYQAAANWSAYASKMVGE